MNYNVKLTPLHLRSEVLGFLDEKKFSRVIDVGASGNSWAKQHLSHWVDVNPGDEGGGVRGFVGNINFPDVWREVLEDVASNGKYDFAVCTHTLEDICNPAFVVQMLSKISNQGFIAVPSKFQELSRGVENSWRGYMHHRWIFNQEGDAVIAYPKLNFVEFLGPLDNVAAMSSAANAELQWWWRGQPDFAVVNGDYLGPSGGAVIQYYSGLLS
jgi:hypothetical protein